MESNDINIIIARTYVLYICNWHRLTADKMFVSNDKFRNSAIYYETIVKNFTASGNTYYENLIFFFQRNNNYAPH